MEYPTAKHVKECEKNREEFSDRMKEQEKEKMEDAPVQEAAIR